MIKKPDFQVEPVNNLTPEVERACKELIAFVLNNPTPQLMVTLTGIQVEGIDRGDFDIIVRRLT